MRRTPTGSPPPFSGSFKNGLGAATTANAPDSDRRYVLESDGDRSGDSWTGHAGATIETPPCCKVVTKGLEDLQVRDWS